MTHDEMRVLEWVCSCGGQVTLTQYGGFTPRGSIQPPYLPVSTLKLMTSGHLDRGIARDHILISQKGVEEFEARKRRT